MKKILILFLVLTLGLALVACGGGDDPCTEHVDANSDGKCDVCEYNVGLPTNPDSPQTGDNSMMHLWIILLCVSGLGVIATTVLGKKRFVK